MKLDKPDRGAKRLGNEHQADCRGAALEDVERALLRYRPAKTKLAETAR